MCVFVATAESRSCHASLRIPITIADDSSLFLYFSTNGVFRIPPVHPESRTKKELYVSFWTLPLEVVRILLCIRLSLDQVAPTYIFIEQLWMEVCRMLHNNII